MKRHPLVVLLAAVVAVTIVLGAVSGLLPRAVTAALDVTNPYRAEYGGITALHVGVRSEYLESLLGRAHSVDPLCEVSVCPAELSAATVGVRVYRGDHSVVRAVLKDDRLAAYLVTTTSRDFTPRITWLGVDFGRLGRVTFEQVLPSNGAPEPSDAAVFLGARNAGYAEVLMGGGASRYEGFLLASAPDGYGGTVVEWDIEAAQALEAWQRANQDRGFEPEPARAFRARTRPNTFGAFRDDGPLGNYFRDAENVRALLSASAGSASR
jgi:hypothetical protein